jgi:hypothetical protein
MGGTDGMNKEDIISRVEEILNERTGDKAGGSGHLSSVYISDIEIDEIYEKADTIEVTVSYTIDVLSEFDLAEEPDLAKEPDPNDPYHYRKSETLILEK